MAKASINTLGASNLSDEERSKLDYYGSDPRTTNALLDVESFDEWVWEPCAGHHLIADEVAKRGHKVHMTDIAEYEGYEHAKLDFLTVDPNETFRGDIITNPPYFQATEFVLKALSMIDNGHKVAMLLRLQFLEGMKRYEALLKDNPPKTVYVFTNRQVCDKNDDFTKGSAVAYAWFVWQKGWHGDPTLKWLTTKQDLDDGYEPVSLFE